MIKILELFGGIGACTKALERQKIPYEIADYVEIDKYAVASYNAIHGTNFIPQDITKWDKDIKVDLIMHGSPCQDFSIAGKQAGGDKDTGTRSSLMYETLRIVQELKPKYVIWENVKNLLSKKHHHNFQAYQDAMAELGYTNYYKVLNAKDFGVPQNRERVFTVSIRNDIPGGFEFPEPEPLTKRLKDMLEDSVDEKYYIKDATSLTIGTNYDTINGGAVGKMHDISRRAYHEDAIAPAMHTCGGGNQEPKVTVSKEISKTIRTGGRGSLDKHTWDLIAEPRILEAKTTRGADVASTIRASIHKQGSRNLIENIKNGRGYEGVAIRTANKKGYDLAQDGDGIDLAYPQSTTRRGRVGHAVAKTLATSDSQGTLDGFRIRKLTPKECWRLMGFDDSDFEKAEKVNSNTQLYKQAGNSIVVDVLERILCKLPIE